MDWKDEIRRTIFRQLPGAKEAAYDFPDPVQLNEPAGSGRMPEPEPYAEEEAMMQQEAAKEAKGEMRESASGETLSQETREWLFKENMRLEGLRSELDKASKMLRQQADQVKADGQQLEKDRKLFDREKEEFKREMKDWNEQIRRSKKSLDDEKNLFDKKYKVLEMGFAKLNEDKKAFEAQKRAFEYKRKFLHEADGFDPMDDTAPAYNGEILFFKGLSHPAAIKKRYKELIKIYHPDNTDGDKYILQRINQEYDRVRRHQL